MRELDETWRLDRDTVDRVTSASSRLRIVVDAARISLTVKRPDPRNLPRWLRRFFHAAILLALLGSWARSPDPVLTVLSAFLLLPALLHASLKEAIWCVARDGPVHRVLRRSLEIRRGAPSDGYRGGSQPATLYVDGQVRAAEECSVLATSSMESYGVLDLQCDPSGVYLVFKDHVCWLETFDREEDAAALGEMLAQNLGVTFADSSALALHPWPHPGALGPGVLLFGLFELPLVFISLAVADNKAAWPIAVFTLLLDAAARVWLGRKLRERVSERTRMAFGV
jgi:hypothetical protein